MKYVKLAFITILAILTVFLYCDDLQDFIDKENKALTDYSNTETSNLKQFKEEENYKLNEFRKEIEAKWKDFKESSPKEWVSYTTDFNNRSSVDFEAGKVQISSLVDYEDEDAKDKAKKALRENLKKIITTKDDQGSKILDNQLRNPVSPNQSINEEDVESIIDDIMESAEKETITGEDNVKRVKYSLNLELVPDHIKIRAEKYKEIIQEKCKKFKVDPSLVMAIIHTESFFNPKAYNRHGNAHGMMQIVPKYAGRTMNNILYGKDEDPSADELFDPGFNIEIGVGYLNWLSDKIWSKVDHADNREFCIICSYNGGHGSVYKAMGLRKRPSSSEKALMYEKLNKWSTEDTFDYLRENIPYEETRNYLKKVSERENQIYNNL